MSSTEDGGPAFPQSPICHGHGMSLRDYFAAQAIGAVCDRLSSPGPLADIVAHDAYAIADAMLAARKDQV